MEHSALKSTGLSERTVSLYSLKRVIITPGLNKPCPSIRYPESYVLYLLRCKRKIPVEETGQNYKE